LAAVAHPATSAATAQAAKADFLSMEAFPGAKVSSISNKGVSKVNKPLPPFAEKPASATIRRCA
jgi:hypothetical protein